MCRSDHADLLGHRGPRLLPTQACRRQETPWKPLRCLKRRLSDVVYRQLAADTNAAHTAVDAGPGGRCGATLQFSVADSHPLIDTSDQPLPGPAQPTLRRPQAGRKTSPKPLLDTEGVADPDTVMCGQVGGSPWGNDLSVACPRLLTLVATWRAPLRLIVARRTYDRQEEHERLREF